MSVATALLWSDLVAALDVPELETEQARVLHLQRRRRENLEDIQAAREQASRVGSMAGQLRYITVCREEIALAELWLDSVGAPYESEES